MGDLFTSDGSGWTAMPLTADEVARIDKAISLDFDLAPISTADHANPFYMALKSMFDRSDEAKILYERKAFSTNSVLPKCQYLFGFKHKEGLCLLMNESRHKAVACGEELERLNQRCFLVNGLQFILQEVEQDKRWCYVPHCLCEHGQRCELLNEAMKLRHKLWDVNIK
jgi:hypothetical protein